MNTHKLKSSKDKNRLAEYLNKISDKHKILLYFLIYTLSFAFIMFLVFYKYITSGKTLIWNLDGMSQHYLVYIYLGEWLREIFHNIFIEGSFVIPMWDLNIGAGSDIITTFNYYGLGDPLCILTAFFNKTNAYYIYDALIIFRLYLAGVFFSCYCFTMKQKGIGVYLGTFSYLFCGYSIFSSVRHPFFILPMIFLPLMLIGAEKILSGKSSAIFIISVFLSLSINFYFAYMVIILTVIYTAVRFFATKKENRTKPFIRLFGKFFLCGIIGVAISAVLLLPVLLVFMNSSRTELSNEMPVVYDLLYYARLYSGFCGYMNAGSWTTTGFVPLTLVCGLLIFRRKGEYNYLKILLIIFSIFLLIPLAGKFLNGFSYTANRWTWCYALLISFITAIFFNKLSELTKADKVYLSVITGVYFITSLVIQKYILSKSNTSVLAQLLILACTVAVIDFGGIFKKHKKRIIAFCTAVLCILSIGLNTYYVHYSGTMDYISEFVTKEDATALLENSVTNKMSPEMQKEIYRYEQIPNRKVRNQSVIDNSHGVSFYWSLTNDNVSNYLHELEAVTFASHDYLNFDRKTFLNELFSVKYFFAPEGTVTVPYGYEYNRTLETHQGNYDVYINQYPLPLGYGYSDYITKDAFENLNAAQKQEVLLSNILLEDTIDNYQANNFNLTSKILTSDFVCGEGVRAKGNRFIVTKNNAEVTYNFDSVENCELYMDFRNLHCEDELWTSDIKKMNGEWDNQDTKYKLKVIKRELLSRDAKKYIIDVASDDCTFSFNLSTPDYQGYDNAHNFLANLGYSEKTRNSITIKFTDAGIYSFDSIDVIVQPMDNYKKIVADRSETILENVVLTDNGFTGNVQLTESQLMFFSVPYSDGFTAYVDGEQVDILKANIWGMALNLPEGNHTIEFRYHTYGLKSGAVISLIGICAFAGILIYENKKKKSNG